MEYISLKSRSKRIIHPYKLVFKQSYWYLYAFCIKSNEFRLFKINRIVSYKLLEENFEAENIDNIEFRKYFGEELFINKDAKKLYTVKLEYDRCNEFFLTNKISAYICSNLNKENGDYIVKTVSFDKEPKTSMGGFRVIPDYSLDDYPKEFSLLLLIGGEAWIHRKNDKVKPLVEYAVKNNILVGAICAATLFMGENGYLDNINHTSNDLNYMKLKCPHYKGENKYIEKQAVCDGNIITANGTSTLEFAKEIMLKLKVENEEKTQEWYEFHKKGYYKDI